MRKNLFLFHHLGLGDHIICNGLYRELGQRNKKVFFIVKTINYRSVKDMLRDVPNIYPIPVPARISDKLQFILLSILRQIGFSTLGLGKYGSGFLDARNDLRFDENFYFQAQIPFEKRWTEFKVPRNLEREKTIFKSFNCESKKYIFLHEDLTRGYVINRAFVNNKYKIIRPNDHHLYRFFDYIYLIEHAAELHCIESSFAALIEGLQLNLPKTAHRYSRPEASSDAKQEFSYLSEWRVIT